MERRTEIVPGRDCRAYGTVKCPHGVIGHGIHGDEWWYIVLEDNYALSLVVHSHQYPVTVVKSLLPSCLQAPEGAHLNFHRHRAGGIKCPWVKDGCETEHLGFIRSADFFSDHGAPTLEQPERFWKAMETELRRQIGE